MLYAISSIYFPGIAGYKMLVEKYKGDYVSLIWIRTDW
jgi:hypothetical protein